MALTFEQIYGEHATFAWRSLRRLGVRDAELEDACQEVFVVIHRKLEEFAGRSSVRSWIFGICLKTAAQYRRRASTRREVLGDELPERSVDAEQHAAAERRQARQVLEGVLASLDEGQRAVFILYELEQMTMAEVAETVGCPLQTAYSRLYAARRLVEAAIAAAQQKRAGEA